MFFFDCETEEWMLSITVTTFLLFTSLFLMTSQIQWIFFFFTFMKLTWKHWNIRWKIIPHGHLCALESLNTDFKCSFLDTVTAPKDRSGRFCFLIQWFPKVHGDFMFLESTSTHLVLVKSSGWCRYFYKSFFLTTNVNFILARALPASELPLFINVSKSGLCTS